MEHLLKPSAYIESCEHQAWLVKSVVAQSLYVRPLYSNVGTQRNAGFQMQGETSGLACVAGPCCVGYPVAS